METLEVRSNGSLSDNASNSLLSIVFEVCPTRDYATDRSMGHTIHAAFLELIEQRDPNLAKRLHSDSDVKPFTLSWLRGPFVFDGGYRWLKAGERYWFRATGFSPEVSSFLLGCLQEPPPAMRLFREEIPVTWATAAVHPAAGTETFQSLYDRLMKAKEPLSRHLTLRFLTPTAFRSGRTNVVFPLPGLVFRTLADKWNSYAPIHLGDVLHRLIDETVLVSRHHLRTQMLDFGDYRQIGFLGDVTYLMDETVPDMLVRMIHLLADFAFYAGVGYKTTMGMGQVKVVGISDGRSNKESVAKSL